MHGQIHRDDVKPIEKYSTDDFAGWFEDGFQALTDANSDNRNRIFSPLHNLLVGRSPIPEQLEEIYRALPNQGAVKKRFRQGLSEAFGQIGREGRSIRALEEILHLAMLIPAAELMPHIVPVVSNLGPTVNNGSLVRHSLTYLGAMVPHEKGAETIRTLLALPGVPNDLAIKAWLQSCRFDQDHWVEHLENLRPKITQALRDYDGPNASVTANNFAAYVSLKTVTKHITRLEYFENKTKAISRDNWLLDALLKNENPPYKVVEAKSIKGEQELQLGYRYDDGGKREAIAFSSKIERNDTERFLNSVVDSGPYQPEAIPWVKNIFKQLGSKTSHSNCTSQSFA